MKKLHTRAQVRAEISAAIRAWICFVLGICMRIKFLKVIQSVARSPSVQEAPSSTITLPMKKRQPMVMIGLWAELMGAIVSACLM